MRLGLGVLIKCLGEGHGEEVFQEAIGKTISKVWLSPDDDSLNIALMDKTAIKIRDEGQSCCETRYMTTDDDLTCFTEAILQDLEVKDCDPVDRDGETEEIQFLEITTSKGCFTMSSHNEHNGYYGGFWLQITKQENLL